MGRQGQRSTVIWALCILLMGEGRYDLTPDGKIIDQGGPGSPPIPVPVFNAIGLLALIAILSVVLAVATLRKRE